MALLRAHLSKRSILGVKVETTPGTDSVPAAANAVFNAYNAKMTPQIQFAERAGQSALSRRTSAKGAYRSQCTFRTMMIGGISPNPFWATVLLPACGLMESTNVYTVTSKPVGASGGHTTVSIYLWEDGKLKKMRGCAGTAVFNYVAGIPISIDWTFTGIWVPSPTDVALITPDYPVDTEIRFASATLTLASFVPRVNSIKLDLGNVVYLREDATDVSGFSCACISDRRVNGTIDPETTLAADYDPYALWFVPTEQALVLTCTAGAPVAVTAPKLQFLDVQGGERGGLATEDIAFQCNRSADAGDDELVITFS